MPLLADFYLNNQRCDNNYFKLPGVQHMCANIDFAGPL